MTDTVASKTGAGNDAESRPRITPPDFDRFALDAFRRFQVPERTSELAIRSMLDASLMGIETHGIESIEMYVNHLEGGGLKPNSEPEKLGGKGPVELWDMKSGFGLASARILMERGLHSAREYGIYFATVRNANHIGACGVYGKIAADQGLVGIVSQQSFGCLSPWGGKKPIIGSSPYAFVAPVQGMFPFYFDCQMASMTRAQVKAHRVSGKPLPEGAAMDSEGNPTTDPEAAWFGQLMPIGKHKGVGFAMVFEILSAVLSGNQFTADLPSIVNDPSKSADSSIFITAIDPAAVAPGENFPERMREYVEYIESSPPIDPENPPRYPGRREGEVWKDRTTRGIPLSNAGVEKFESLSKRLGIPPIEKSEA
ncbi:MAG: Ldh family oxidoreductase [Candidatus Omnitrophica bacterium]|nr:Ldh family oxidoreductase [Candidatus Omnitrophota bacterium]